MNSAVASHPKIIVSKCQQRPGNPKQAVREAALAEGALSPAAKQLPAPRRRGKESLVHHRGAGRDGGRGRGGGGLGSGGAEERARARRPCPRLPDNAASFSSPRTAPAGSTASGGSQRSSQHVPGGGRIPPGGQLRAAQRRDEPWGARSAESSGNGAGPRRRPGVGAACSRERGGPAPGGGRIRPPPLPRSRPVPPLPPPGPSGLRPVSPWRVWGGGDPSSVNCT